MLVIRSNVFSKSVAYISVSIVYTLLSVSNWQILQFWNVSNGSNFVDLKAVLMNVDCFGTIGNGIFETSLGDTCKNYVYGSFLIRVLNFLSIGSDFTTLFGFVLLIFLSIILANFLVAQLNKPIKYLFLAIVIVFSPPVMLLAERGNVDLIIFLMVYLASYLFKRNSLTLSFLTLCVATLFKFYTFPILIYIVVVQIFRKNFFKGATYALFSFLVLVLIIFDLQKIGSIYINTWYAAFGNQVWGQYLNRTGIVELDKFTSSLVGLSMVFISVFLIRRASFRKYLSVSNEYLPKNFFSNEDPIRAFCIIAFLGCYFAGINYDYRLIFLAGYLLIIPLGITHKDYFKGFAFVVVGIFWMSYNSWYFQLFGDLLILIFVSTFISHIMDRWQFNGFNPSRKVNLK